MTDNYEIVRASKDNIHYLFDYAEQEQWNPALDDDKTFISAYPDAFYLGLLNGNPVSCLSAPVYQNSYAFIGYYIVAQPENRHKGLGLLLWNHVFEQLESKGIINMGLNALLVQADNYAKGGFKGTHKNLRYVYTVSGEEHAPPEVLTTASGKHQAITQFDGQFVPEKRPNFIKAWLHNNHAHHCHIQDENGAIRAYGCIRKAAKCYRAGPLYADTLEQTVALLHTLTAGLQKGEQVYMDIPDSNPYYLQFVKILNLSYADFECLFMYRGTPPHFPKQKIFAVSTIETG